MHAHTFVPLGATTMLAPLPVVMVSCRADEKDTPNIITVAWAGIVNSDPPMLSISVRPERFSHEKIVQSGEFYVNLTARALADATDFCGVKSGRDIDKFKQCNLTPVYLDALNIAPAIAEAPVVLACRVEQQQTLGSHDLFLARIVQVYVQESLIDEDKSLNLAQANLVAYSHGEYVPVGEKFGFFGYSVASPKAFARRMGKK